MDALSTFQTPPKGYHKSKTDPKERQLRETPHEIVRALVAKYGCQIDLAATRENRRLRLYLSDEPGDINEGYRGDAFDVQWNKIPKHNIGEDIEHEYLKVGFCNPPYNKIHPWLQKAIVEADEGFTSVFLIPTFNGEKWNRWAMHAAEIILLEGRVSFILPSTGKPDPGNNRGSMIAVFAPHMHAGPAFEYMTLNNLVAYGRKDPWSVTQVE